MAKLRRPEYNTSRLPSSPAHPGPPLYPPQPQTPNPSTNDDADDVAEGSAVDDGAEGCTAATTVASPQSAAPQDKGADHHGAQDIEPEGCARQDVEVCAALQDVEACAKAGSRPLAALKRWACICVASALCLSTSTLQELRVHSAGSYAVRALMMHLRVHTAHVCRLCMNLGMRARNGSRSRLVCMCIRNSHNRRKENEVPIPTVKQASWCSHDRDPHCHLLLLLLLSSSSSSSS